jgi:alpha-N-arabinofuranosidase
MDELLTKNEVIMDKYDPDKRVGLIVDEWGTWYDVEPGTNPGFLYQQNTMRDALVAGLTLNIFHKHCEWVRMANIAQVVNVLQAVILTEGEKMVLTPTYHVFDMYKVHQDAELLDLTLDCGKLDQSGKNTPAVSASASRDGEGRIHISLCNLNPAEGSSVSIDLRGMGESAWKVSGTVLAESAMDAHNSFQQPDAVQPREFAGFTAEPGQLKVELPPMSVVVLCLTSGN